MLQDHTWLALGLVDLYEATGEVRWLSRARDLSGEISTRFAAENGGWYRSPEQGDQPLIRDVPVTDADGPSGNAAAILLHLRLHLLTGQQVHRERAEGGLAAASSRLQRGDRALSAMATALSWVHTEPEQIVLTGGEGYDEMSEVLRRTYLPHAVVVRLPAGIAPRGPDALELAVDKLPVDGRSTAYVCHQGVCEAPLTDPSAFAALLEDQVRDPHTGSP